MNKMNKLVSTSKLSRALKTLWKKSKDLFATKTELAGKSDKSHNHDNIYAKIIGGSHEFGGNADKITTEQFIELLKIKGMFSHYNSYTRGTWHYANNQTISDTGCGDISLAGATIEVMRTDDERFTIRVHTATTADSSTAKISGDFIYVNNGKQYKPGWRRLFNTDVPPAWEELIHKPSTFPPTDHNHDTKYYRVDLPTITSGDFNNYYTDQGIHNVSSGATIANAPYTGGIYGLLTISERSGGDVRQTFIDYNHKEFTRTRNGNTGAWSAWIKVFSSAQKPTWNDIDGKPSSFPPAAHNHDDRYYTEDEVNRRLANKSNRLVSDASGNSRIIIEPVAILSEKFSEYTGMIKITLPKSWSNTMLSFDLICYDYSARGRYAYHLSGYNYETDKKWVNVQVSTEGNPVTTKVRFAHDGSKCCVILGDVKTLWSYPKFAIDNVFVGHSNIDGWDSGWSISRITSENGLTSISNAYDNDTTAHSHYHDNRYLKINNSKVTDFNLCKTAGPYSVSSNSSVPNAPFTGAIFGSLMVAIVSPNEVTQTFTSYNGRVYTRFLNDRNGGTWAAWSTIYTSANYGSIQAGVTITREGDRLYINY